MKRLAMVFTFVLMAATAFAQSKDFAGSWVLDAEKTGTTQGPPSLTIKMTAAEFNVKMGQDELIFKLDGTETELPHGGRGKVVWKGNKLDATITSARGPQTVTFSREGAWLVQEGQSSRGPLKFYFKKAPAK
jgi:hypothetical protein